MSEAFVVANKNRLAIFVEIMAGESSVERIAKKHRLIPQVAKRAADELLEEGLLASGDEGLKLSESGSKVAQDLKRKDLIT